MSNKKYDIKYKDIYIYGRLTQYFTDLSVIPEVETPYKEDGEKVQVSLHRNSARGYGRRNWQREQLESNRGHVIVLYKGNHHCLVGIKDPHTNVVTLFKTNIYTELQRQMTDDIEDHLKRNGIEVEISTEESLRAKLQKKWQAGDRIQREAGRSGHGREYGTDPEPATDGGW